MDLQLYLRVLWRFRLLVFAGFAFAIGLAFLSFVRVDFDGGSPSFTYREQESWMGHAVLLVTEHDFPWGRSVFQEEIRPISPDEAQSFTPEFAPSSRFTELANVYAQLATSDPVRRLIRNSGPPFKGAVQAYPLIATNGSDAPLPMISIEATAPTPESAVHLAQRATDAFTQYLEAEQEQSDIPADERVVLTLVKSPGEVELMDGRSKTLPAAIFLTVMLAVIGLAFVLENLRPRVRPIMGEADVRAEDPRARRTA